MGKRMEREDKRKQKNIGKERKRNGKRREKE